jgi:hypothetical protein
MAEKVSKLGVVRDEDFMYYIKAGDVWRTPRKKPGEPKGAAALVARAGIEMDFERYLYFLDQDGDIARMARAGRQAAEAAPAPAPAPAAAPPAAAPTPAVAEPAADEPLSGWFPGLPKS